MVRGMVVSAAGALGDTHHVVEAAPRYSNREPLHAMVRETEGAEGALHELVPCGKAPHMGTEGPVQMPDVVMGACR